MNKFGGIKNAFQTTLCFSSPKKEKEEVVANCDHLNKLKYSPSLPFAFTEHGALMVASILNSERAIAVSVFVVRAFVNLRKILVNYEEIRHRISEIELQIGVHAKFIMDVLKAIEDLKGEPGIKQLGVGFGREKPSTQ